MDDIKAAARKIALAVYDEWGECCTVEEMVAAIAAALLEAKAEAIAEVTPGERICYCGGSKGHWPNCPNEDRWAMLAAQERYHQAAAQVRRGE